MCNCGPHYCFRKRYGFLHFLWDCFLVIISLGLWGIWIFVREMRGRRCC